MNKIIEQPSITDFMTKHVLTVSPEMNLDEVISALLKNKVSNAPVVKIEGNKHELLGFISERDCLEYLSDEIFYGNPDLTAESMMKKIPLCVSPDTDIFAVTSTFISHGYRHLPVVQDKELLGIISRSDVLRGLYDYYHKLLKAQAHERFPPDLRKLINHRFMMG